MPIFRSRGVVLGNRNLGEADKIVKFFTERYGKINGVIKGARKIKNRNSGDIQPLNLVNLIYFDRENKGLVNINSCEIIISFHKIREDFERLNRGLYLIELIDLVLKERQKNKHIFDLITHIISSIEASRLEKIDTLLRVFEIRTLSLIGYRPRLDKCVKCNHLVQKRDSFKFSSLSGGILCNRCSKDSQDVLKITPGVLNFIKKAMVVDLERVTRLKLNFELNRELSRLMNTYIETHLGKSPKTYKFLDQLSDNNRGL